jgi:hypothetical protein
MSNYQPAPRVLAYIMSPCRIFQQRGSFVFWGFRTPLVGLILACVIAPAPARAVEDDLPADRAGMEPAAVVGEKPPADQHILKVIPNYKTVEDPSQPVEPMPIREKFKLGAKDSFDPHALPVIAIYAGIEQLQNQYKSFGQGMEGFGKRYAGSYADQAIGNMLGEAVFPSVLHEDPRYFRKGRGNFFARAGYAMSRVLVTRTDAGSQQFNFSEFLGNGAQAAISNVYYPAPDRTLHQTAYKAISQTVLDSLFNIAKEYWPDVRQRLFRKSNPYPAP